MIIPMLCVTIFVILVVWFLLPRVARLMIHTPTAISIFVCLSMVQLMAVFISMRCTLCTLPTGSVDPNFGRRVRNRRQLNSLQNTWPYGYSMPIAVRYTQGAFSRSGWLWPVDAKGEPLKATSYMAVGFYVAKYVNKKSDMDLAAKGLGAKEWNNSLKTKLSLLPKKLFRIRMSRNFGMKMLTMTNLSTECLIQLTKLGYDATPFNQILKQNAKREMRLRLGKV